MSSQIPDAELDRWNGRFAAEHCVFGTAPNAFLAAQASRLSPGMRALCVADGEGRNSVWLARQGLLVTAFYFSPIGIAKARRLAEQSGVKVDYRLSRVDDWRWDAEPYDVVEEGPGHSGRSALIDLVARRPTHSSASTGTSW